jgi:hypothetical protein
MNSRLFYLLAINETPSLGIASGLRREPSLDEARVELSGAISRVATKLLNDKCGPLLGEVSQPAVNEFLKSFELNLSRAKGDLTLVLEELFERLVK